MDKPAGLADIGSTALVEERDPKKRNKGCRDQSLSFIEVVTFADLTAERMRVDRYSR